MRTELATAKPRPARAGGRSSKARKQSVTVLLNRGGGTAAADGEVQEKVEQALKRAGIVASVEMIDGSECEDRARAAVERKDPLLIVGGGDGTISAAAAALAGSKTALGILPLGTLNHFARDLGIPFDIAGAADVIAGGAERPVDVAEMNGRVFINNSAIGLYPLMVLDREAQQRRLGRGKKLAMLVASVRTLARFHHERLTLTVDNEKARLDTPLLFVGNNDYSIDLSAPGRRTALDDGQLCVLVMRKKTRRGLIGASVRALLGRSRSDDMVRIDGVERLRVTGRSSYLTVSLDGEIVRMRAPLEYRLRKRALRVIAPSAAKEA